MGDSGDAVMARWLQSAGLQHLATSSAGGGDYRGGMAGLGGAGAGSMLPNLLMQGYGPQSVEEKQRLYTLLRSLNFNGESAVASMSETYTPTAQSFGGGNPVEGFYSPELRGDLGAGLLDLHAMDDTELLSEDVVSEPFEASPFMAKEIDDDEDDVVLGSQQVPLDNYDVLTSEKETTARENNVAKIKVVVRKRPLNRKELSRKEEDIISVHDSSFLTVYEPKLKVDLTAYVEKHEFCFDAVLDEHVSNDEVYRETVEPGEEYEFRRDLKVKAFRTYHAIPSQGYVIYSVKQKLKQEFIGLPGSEIKQLKLSGVEITNTVSTPEIAFTGDTTSDFILDPNNADVLGAKILVVESTFLDDSISVEHAREYGHTHLFEIVSQSDKLGNKSILLIHFSARYTTEEIDAAINRLPPSFRSRVYALKEGF